MFCLFNSKGELKIGIVIFKRYHPAKKAGAIYDVLGNVLTRGTTYDFELRRKRYSEVIEIK